MTITKSEEARVDEYAKSVSAFHRGPWLTDWGKKCPCHALTFNCAEFYCSDKREDKLDDCEPREGKP